MSDAKRFVSRAGLKLDHALSEFGIDVTGFVGADLGCNAGGFTDCLLNRKAAKVYAIDTGYGVLDWKLRKNPHVVVMERTNAMHVELPELVDIVVIDVAWTKQKFILPPASKMLKQTGIVITLVKPHYEAEKSMLRDGVLMDEHLYAVIEKAKSDCVEAKFEIVKTTLSPIKGAGGNVEMLFLLRPYQS